MSTAHTSVYNIRISLQHAHQSAAYASACSQISLQHTHQYTTHASVSGVVKGELIETTNPPPLHHYQLSSPLHHLPLKQTKNRKTTRLKFHCNSKKTNTINEKRITIYHQEDNLTDLQAGEMPERAQLSLQFKKRSTVKNI